MRIPKPQPDITAVLEVTDPEPPATDSPVTKLPNVVLTPHITGSAAPCRSPTPAARRNRSGFIGSSCSEVFEIHERNSHFSLLISGSLLKIGTMHAVKRRQIESMTRVLLMVAFTLVTNASAADLRQTINFNREWKFLLGDHPGAEAVAYDDSRWDAIGLPHSFSVPYFAANDKFYVGYGWYRKPFEAPQSWVGKRVFAEFEAAFQDAEVFVNGTDDAHVVVTVVDAAGKPLSNSVPVTLTVESGPGEFPTGPSITFAPGSDITIRDGQAAIEFRSYYAGTSGIRATSPGLKDDMLTLSSKGDPAYVAGRTPPVQPRPYRRLRPGQREFAGRLWDRQSDPHQQRSAWPQREHGE